MPIAALVVKFVSDVPVGTVTFVNKTPPANSTKGTMRLSVSKFHFNTTGLNPAPYALFAGWKTMNTGTASTAYSNFPRKKPGPCAFVSIQPKRTPALNTLSLEVLPLTPCPPPAQISNSWPPSCGRFCANAGAQQSSAAHRSTGRSRVIGYFHAFRERSCAICSMGTTIPESSERRNCPNHHKKNASPFRADDFANDGAQEARA